MSNARLIVCYIRRRILGCSDYDRLSCSIAVQSPFPRRVFNPNHRRQVFMLAQGSVINDRYQIIRQVGQGGMGAVYEAFDQRLRSPVALKQMMVSVEQYGRAFEREAQLLANLRHSALPKVIDYFVS